MLEDGVNCFMIRGSFKKNQQQKEILHPKLNSFQNFRYQKFHFFQKRICTIFLHSIMIQIRPR